MGQLVVWAGRVRSPLPRAWSTGPLQRGQPQSDTPPATSAKREMLMRWPPHRARSKTRALDLFFCSLNHSESHRGRDQTHIHRLITGHTILNVFGTSESNIDYMSVNPRLRCEQSFSRQESFHLKNTFYKQNAQWQIFPV